MFQRDVFIQEIIKKLENDKKIFFLIGELVESSKIYY